MVWFGILVILMLCFLFLYICVKSALNFYTLKNVIFLHRRLWILKLQGYVIKFTIFFGWLFFILLLIVFFLFPMQKLCIYKYTKSISFIIAFDDDEEVEILFLNIMSILLQYLYLYQKNFISSVERVSWNRQRFCVLYL